MSDIRKEIKLIASLDTSKIREEMQKLGMSSSQAGAAIGGGKGAGIDSVQVDNFKKAVEGFTSTLKDLSKEFQKALGGNKTGGIAPGVQPGVNDVQSLKEPKSKKIEIFDENRGTYKKLGKGELYDYDAGKKFKKEEDQVAFKEAKENRLAEKLHRKELTNQYKLSQAKEQDSQKLQQKTQQANEKSLAKATKQADVEMAKKAQKQIQEEKKAAAVAERAAIAIAKKEAKEKEKEKKLAEGGGSGGSGSGGGDGGRGEKPNGFKVGLGAVASLGTAGLGIVQLQRTMLQFHNQRSLDTLAGNSAEGTIREQGRAYGTLGSMSGAAAGAATGGLAGMAIGTAIMPVVGTAIAGAIGAIGGGIAGMLAGQSINGEKEVEKYKVGLDSFQKAQELFGPRMNIMRGGGVDTTTLSAVQGLGVKQGYTPQETLQHFGQARDNLGNKTTARMLDSLQELQNRTGLGVGSSSQGIETMVGSGHISADRGMQKIQDIMKKGVAQGFDSSRVRDLVEVTNQHLQEQTGLAKLDTSVVSDRLVALAKGFAGNGPLTDIAMSQAAKAAGMERTLSASTSGIAGIGNLTGIQDINKKSGGNMSGFTMLSLAGISKYDDGTAVDKTLDAQSDFKGDRSVIKKMVKDLKKDTYEAGVKTTGISGDAALYIKNQELGNQYTEDTTGLNNAQANAPGTLGLGKLPEGSKAGGGEFQNLVLRASQEQEVFITSVGAVGQANNMLKNSITDLVKHINESVLMMQKYKLNMEQQATFGDVFRTPIK